LQIFLILLKITIFSRLFKPQKISCLKGQLISYLIRIKWFSRRPIGYSRRPIGYSRHPIGYSRHPIGYSRHPIGYLQRVYTI